jgi:hypothetical protein
MGGLCGKSAITKKHEIDVSPVVHNSATTEEPFIAATNTIPLDISGNTVPADAVIINVAPPPKIIGTHVPNAIETYKITRGQIEKLNYII